jgi:hypothetical protein
MKFLLGSLASCPNRIGCIKDFERLPSLVLETPLLLLYTKVPGNISICTVCKTLSNFSYIIVGGMLGLKLEEIQNSY